MASIAASLESPRISSLSAGTRAVIEGALGPDEWRSWPNEPIAGAESEEAARKLVDRWRTVVCARTGSEEPFRQRLETLQIAPEEAFERLLPRRIIADGAAPAWALTLEGALGGTPDDCARAIEWAGAETPAERELFEIGRHPAPRFAELVSPFIAQFRSAIGGGEAYCAVARSLLRRLSFISGRTVAYELRLARENGELAGDTPEARYRNFVQARLAEPVARRNLFLRYPVLARFLATMTMNFAVVTNEVAERLERDRAAIVAGLLHGVDPGDVRLFYPGLSDMHCGGRSAWIIEFENGSRIVYKPRDHSSDRAYAALLEWLNAKSPSVDLRSPACIARDGYGWNEFVPALECESEDAVCRYYRRQGFHAALVHFLCGLDFHADNFVAHGEYPVPVDLEGLLSPSLAVAPPEMASLPLELMPLQFTMATSLLLPYWRGGNRDRLLYTASGIGGSGNRLWPTKRAGWKNVNTDSFGIEFEWREIEFKTSVPRFRNGEAAVDVPAIEAGFRDAWGILVEGRDELLAESGPLEAFRRLRSRFLFRDTQDYEDILFWTTAADLLASGAACDVAFESLAGSVPVFFTGASFPELIDEEKRCLWGRDIPIALADPNDTGMRLPEGRYFGPVIPLPMFEQMTARIRNASDRELEFQCGLIRSMFEMSFEAAQSERARRRDGETDRSRILDCATAIGESLERTALRCGGHTGWLGFVRFAGAGARVQPVHTEPWSLNGDAGNGLFLINLARATGERRFEETGRDALASATRAVQEMVGGGLLNLVSVSGYVGFFGLVYALAAAGVQLDDHRLVRQAADLALAYPIETAAAETNPDFLTGAAGPVAILSWLHSLTGDARVLDSARLFARSIARAGVDGGAGGWQVPYFKRPLLGMAHGSAGISAALLRLYRQTGDAEYRDAALTGLAHERANFQHADGQWPNFQEEPGRIAYMTGWCAGAAGIGLARLEAFRCGLDNPEIRFDIEAAIAATRRNLGGIQHHACCGEAGRITFMAAAARDFERPELHAEAVSAGVGMIDHFEAQGYWYLQEFCERLAIPGLLAGVPGVGMALLSLVHPAVSGVLALC